MNLCPTGEQHGLAVSISFSSQRPLFAFFIREEKHLLLTCNLWLYLTIIEFKKLCFRMLFVVVVVAKTMVTVVDTINHLLYSKCSSLGFIDTVLLWFSSTSLAWFSAFFLPKSSTLNIRISRSLLLSPFIFFFHTPSLADFIHSHSFKYCFMVICSKFLSTSLLWPPGSFIQLPSCYPQLECHKNLKLKGSKKKCIDVPS